jgi:hypothetical protein
MGPKDPASESGSALLKPEPNQVFARIRAITVRRIVNPSDS